MISDSASTETSPKTVALPALLELPFAKLVLAFEEVQLSKGSPVYDGLCAYVGAKTDAAGYVRWGLDSIERLLTSPHEEVLDEALMRLAVHTGEAEDSLNGPEIRDDLRRLCTHLQLSPPKGEEAVKLYILGVLEDLVYGVIPAARTREVLTNLHGLVSEHHCGKALDHISFFYWQVDEWDNLSRLGLEQGAPSRDDILRNFRQYAEELLTAMKVVSEQKGGIWHICVETA